MTSRKIKLVFGGGMAGMVAEGVKKDLEKKKLGKNFKLSQEKGKFIISLETNSQKQIDSLKGLKNMTRMSMGMLTFDYEEEV